MRVYMVSVILGLQYLIICRLVLH